VDISKKIPNFTPGSVTTGHERRTRVVVNRAGEVVVP